MKSCALRWIAPVLCLVLAPGATTAQGSQIQDIARLKGLERNVLTGMGIVIGLDGTGDQSKKSLAVARPYEQLMRQIGNPVASIDELAAADSYALVMVTMEIPGTGGREGDRFDVQVETLYNAKSLQGGRLIVSPLHVPMPGMTATPPLAIATGSVKIEGDNQRSGVVRQGGQLLEDRELRQNAITSQGYMELVLFDDKAGYVVAAAVAEALNLDPTLARAHPIAVVTDPKTIKILVPEEERADPASFIAAIMRLTIDPSLLQTNARIVINEKKGIIAVTGNVEIGPIAITHKNMSISTISPPPIASPLDPIITTAKWTGINTIDRRGRSATQLQDLLDAFERLKVPTADQISILYEMRKAGVLYAEIIHE